MYLFGSLINIINRYTINLRRRILIGIKENSINKNWVRVSETVHRYYAESFLHESSEFIKGHCLEFQEDTYSSRFAKEKLIKVDILHKEHGNSNATLVADLCKENNISPDLFDCIICTYTLHLVYDFESFVSELYRILKPGGTLLIVVPHIMVCYPIYHEYWRFTAEGLHLLLSKFFGDDNTHIRSYGNSLTAAGELRGLTARDFLKSELDEHDPRYAMVICARAMKAI